MSGKPLKLLLLVNQLSPIGGAEVQLAHLADGLAARGHAVTVGAIDHKWAETRSLAPGVKLVELHASNRYRRLAAVPRLARLARRADVVQCTMWDPSLWGRLAAILARRPVIVADHATDRSVQITAGGGARASWIAAHNRLLDPFTYATVSCAASQREVLLGEGVAAAKIVHIPNGIPVARLREEAAQAPGREQLGLPAGPLVLQVGVFRPEKNQLGALEAFPSVRERVPDAQLVFAGDGDTRAAVEARAAELGTGEWAHFLGARDDVPALLAHADLMLLPSLADAMPMTVLEALAVGTPVVASDVGDVAAMLGEGGVCVPPGDDEALAAATVRVLDEPALRDSLRTAAAERAAGFDSAAMVDAYEALFHGAVTGLSPLGALRGLAG